MDVQEKAYNKITDIPLAGRISTSIPTWWNLCSCYDHLSRRVDVGNRHQESSYRKY